MKNVQFLQVIVTVNKRMLLEVISERHRQEQTHCQDTAPLEAAYSIST